LLLAIVDLHLWILVCLLLGNILAVHIALGMAALAVNGLWDGQLDCILDSEHG
jgi:hypothetical protein